MILRDVPLKKAREAVSSDEQGLVVCRPPCCCQRKNSGVPLSFSDGTVGKEFTGNAGDPSLLGQVDPLEKG